MKRAVAAADLLELDDEVAGLIRPHLGPKAATLDAISVALVEKRNEAVAARAASGIEAMWQECEEAYVGIDDANRAEFGAAKWSKAMSPEGPVTTNKIATNTEKKSTAFIRLTARYVDAGAAKLTEILLPADDKAFSFTATPLPEVSKAKDDKSQVVNDQGVPLTRPARPHEMPAVTTSAAAPTNSPDWAAGACGVSRRCRAARRRHRGCRSGPRASGGRCAPDAAAGAADRQGSGRGERRDRAQEARRRPRPGSTTGWSSASTPPRCAR
jgi:hypothetical protein